MKTRIKNALWKSINLLPLKMRLVARVTFIKCGLSKYENEWSILHHLGPNHGTALDIGANRGYYSIRLAGLYDHVIAFEPNVDIASELVAARHPKIFLKNSALSSNNGTQKLFIPISKTGELLDGWASFNHENYGDRIGEKNMEVPTQTLDELKADDVTFVKMDVEGHEIEVIKGGMNFLAKHKPVMLVEICDEHLDTVQHLLSSIGLQQHSLPDPCSDNMYLFKPGTV